MLTILVCFVAWQKDMPFLPFLRVLIDGEIEGTGRWKKKKIQQILGGIGGTLTPSRLPKDFENSLPERAARLDWH